MSDIFWVCALLFALAKFIASEIFCMSGSFRIYLPGIETPFGVWAFVFVSLPPSWPNSFWQQVGEKYA